MSDVDPSSSPKAVFLSYTSDDMAVALAVCEALRESGIEVWMDRSELQGGDAWDAKIRGQIASCALFVPVISAATQARREGYFRLEWRLADQRTHMMGKTVAFILPVCIDTTRDSHADVPDSFLAVQWTRLPGGETPEKFCARVKALLGADAVEGVARGLRTPPSVDAQSRSARFGDPALQPKVGRALRARLVAALTVVALAVAAIVFWPKRHEPAASTEPSAQRSTPPTTAAPTPPLSEARRLAQQAQEILFKTELGLTELDAASLLCERAANLDSSDPEVWATASEVESWRVHFGGDRTPERHESARLKAARALNLAPNGFAARRAQACYQVCVLRGAAAQEAELILRSLLQERPRDRHSLLVLGLLLGNQKQQVEEAVAIFERLAALPGQAARAYNEIGWLHMFGGRFEDANAAIDRSLAAEPFTGNVALKVFLAENWLGDLDAALAALKQLPRAKWHEDRALATAVRVFHWRHEPDQILALLGGVPRDWITWSIDGPKAAITGDAHAQLNHTAAARNDWASALALVEQRLTADPNGWKLNAWKAYLLSALGQGEASARAFALARESSSAANGQLLAWLTGTPDTALAYNLLPRLLPADQILGELEKRVASPNRCPPVANLRLNPSLAAARELPGFAAILEKAASHPNTAPSSNRQTSAATPAEKSAPAGKSVAVLAFRNLSDAQSGDYFSDGLSEELGNVLGRVPGLRVAGSTSAFSFKGKAVTLPEIARQLGVAYLVEGSVQREAAMCASSRN